MGGIAIGLINQAIRGLKNSFRNLSRLLQGKQGKRRIKSQPIKVPRSWGRKRKASPSAMPGKSQVIYRNKKRVPGLLWFKRILAGVLLLINFSFSQFLLGSMGSQAQPMFALFFLNSFILLDYLWKTRRTSQ